MADDATYDVFISYSSKDKTWVRGELLKRLDEAGLKTFIDFRDFEVGAPSLTEMERGVVQSRKTLLVLTPNYVGSEWTEFETIMVQTLDPAARARRIIPLMKQKCDLPLRIKMLNYVDFSDPADVDFAWQKLLKALAAPKPNVAAPKPTTPTETAPSATGGVDINDLRQKLIERLSMGDLRDLAFVLGLDDDNYPAVKNEFINEFLKTMRQQGRLDELVKTLQREKPWVLR